MRRATLCAAGSLMTVMAAGCALGLGGCSPQAAQDRASVMEVVAFAMPPSGALGACQVRLAIDRGVGALALPEVQLALANAVYTGLKACPTLASSAPISAVMHIDRGRLALAPETSALQGGPCWAAHIAAQEPLAAAAQLEAQVMVGVMFEESP